MSKIIRFALLFVVLGIGIVSTASTRGIEARTTKESAVKPPPLSACPLPIPVCIPEKYFDYTVCRCVPRP
jgi:hypothetical protein